MALLFSMPICVGLHYVKLINNKNMSTHNNPGMSDPVGKWKTTPNVLAMSEVSADMVKTIADSRGTMKVQEDAAKTLADYTTFYLQMVISEATNFSVKGRSKKLTNSDLQNTFDALRIPLETSHGNQLPVFRHVRAGSKDVFFTEDKEVDIEQLLEQPVPKLPCEPMIKAHWLSIEGIEPTISENPPQVSKSDQQVESLNPEMKSANFYLHPDKVTDMAHVKVKDPSAHDLSMEQQYYYIQITEACVGTDESRRAQALRSLATEPGLYQLLPRFALFILEGVKLNVANNNLAMLIYLMRMVKSLLENQSLYLEKYLHQLTPAVATCIVCKQLCMRPEADNHWALRDFAARLLAQMCKTFNTTVNNIQSRICKLFTDKILNEHTPLVTHYGIFHFFWEAGQEIMLSCAIPALKFQGEKIRACLESPPSTIAPHSRSAAERLKAIIPKKVGEILKQTRQPPDILEEYKNEYGYLGPLIHATVLKARQTQAGSSVPVVRPVPTPVGQQPRAAGLVTQTIVGLSLKQP